MSRQTDVSATNRLGNVPGRVQTAVEVPKTPLRISKSTSVPPTTLRRSARFVNTARDNETPRGQIVATPQTQLRRSARHAAITPAGSSTLLKDNRNKRPTSDNYGTPVVAKKKQRKSGPLPSLAENGEQSFDEAVGGRTSDSSSSQFTPVVWARTTKLPNTTKLTSLVWNYFDKTARNREGKVSKL